MSIFAHFRPRPGLGRRLRFKTSPSAPVVVAVLHIRPYLDNIYERIAENPDITVQGLSDLFVADSGQFFDREQLRATTARLKKRHAISKRGSKSSTAISVFLARRVSLTHQTI